MLSVCCVALRIVRLIVIDETIEEELPFKIIPRDTISVDIDVYPD